jgi:hypothetical protein
MSQRSVYLRDQAQKCTSHAEIMNDAQTKAELRGLASKYTAEAAEIESKEARALHVPPTLWGPAPLTPDTEPRVQ